MISFVVGNRVIARVRLPQISSLDLRFYEEQLLELF